MQYRKAISALLLLIFACSITAVAQQAEQDIVDRYLKKAEVMHVKKLGWVSVNLGMNRINRNNDYNTFATIESSLLDGPSISWLDRAWSLGAEFGLMFYDKFAWGFGGEYWLKIGDEYSGTYNYYPSGGLPTTVSNLQSKIKVYGAYTTVGYYLHNPPSKSDRLTKLAVRIGGTVGMYIAKWDLWPEYQNLNLATSQPTGVNTTFQGTAPGFTLNLAAEYPVGFWDLAMVVDVNYLYLNFSNVAWYNSNDDEVIVSWDGTPDDRVDLALSGIRAKLEVKRLFSF